MWWFKAFANYSEGKFIWKAIITKLNTSSWYNLSFQW